MTNSLEPSSSFGGAESAPVASWRWRFEDRAGTEVQGPAGGTAATAGAFSSQSDAESWIGETWQDLLDEGVDQVSLFEADRLVYAAMGLHPAP